MKQCNDMHVQEKQLLNTRETMGESTKMSEKI